MHIEYLKYFEKALKDWDKVYAPERLASSPLSMSQIEVIENEIYKINDKKSPAVLRELLYLSGRYCPFFSTRAYFKNKNSLDIKELLKEQNYNPYFMFLEESKNELNYFENRLIWTFNTCYESTEEFYFIYLDEDENDPLVYYFDGDELDDTTVRDVNSLIHKKQKLSKFIYQLYAIKMNSKNRPLYNENVFSTYVNSNSNTNTVENLEKFYTLISNLNLSGVKFFIEQGVDVTANNNQAIILASDFNDIETVNLLVANGADIFVQNELILLHAVKFGNPIFLRDLLNRYRFSQLNINKALVIACSKGVSPSYLIDAGAEISSFNSLGLQLAIRNKHFSLVSKLIRNYGANNNVNSGYLLLFKNEIYNKVKHEYTKKTLLNNVTLTNSKRKIINKHNSDLREYYGNKWKCLSRFPEKIAIEVEEYENTTMYKSNDWISDKPRVNDKNSLWSKLKGLWS